MSGQLLLQGGNTVLVLWLTLFSQPFSLIFEVTIEHPVTLHTSINGKKKLAFICYIDASPSSVRLFLKFVRKTWLTHSRRILFLLHKFLLSIPLLVGDPSLPANAYTNQYSLQMSWTQNSLCIIYREKFILGVVKLAPWLTLAFLVLWKKIFKWLAYFIIWDYKK